MLLTEPLQRFWQLLSLLCLSPIGAIGGQS